jgi:phosphatidylinositol glycan class A protein
MTNSTKGILLITPFFAPNIGGVETHLTDLVNELNRLKYQIYVHTYSPLTTSNTNWKTKETIGNIHIRRYTWPGKNIFHHVEKYPLLDFIYLTPYLFLRTFFWTLKNHSKINVIHSHGFNGAVCGILIGKIFSKKHLTSTHALYPNQPNSLTAKISRFILNQTDIILVQSDESKKQLLSWGVQKNKIKPYRYWIDPKKFNTKKTQLHSQFTVIFVSRLIPKKGTRTVLKLAKQMPKINFVMIGSGPEANFIQQHLCPNLNFIGQVSNDQLLDYYSQSDIFIQPALYLEGFTRTIMEAVSCGLPVIASNLGTIPEIVDSSVSILVKPTVNNFKQAINKLYLHPDILKKMKQNCPKYTQKNFNPQNIKLITKYF